MMEWYYTLGIISYGIFLVQFILSLVSGDVDFDFDCDGDTDFDTGDILSFKGLVHFCMGLSGFLMICGKVTVTTVLMAILVGVLFIIILAAAYNVMLKLKYEPQEKSGPELIGRLATVYVILPGNNNRCKCLLADFTEIECTYTEPVKEGAVRVIKGYTNGTYII
jgi:membrane protein implicated in regulation of membrane protease activity